MTKIVPVPDNDTTTYDPMEERTFTVTVAVNDKDGHYVNIIARDKETQKGIQFALPRQKYDREASKWVDDKETLEASEAISKDKFNQSLDELVKSFGYGLEFTGYTDGEIGTFEPRPRYIKFDKLDTPATKLLKKNKEPLGVLPITESNNPGWARFNFGITVTDGEGEVKKFRVSQIVIEHEDENVPDTIVPLKYTTKKMQSYKDALDSPALPAEAYKDLADIMGDLLEVQRKEKIGELNHKLGVDMEELLQGDKTVEFESVEVRAVGSGDAYYLVGTLAS